MALKQTGFTCLTILSCILVANTFSEDDFEIASDSVLTVEHTFESGPFATFKKRGTVIIQSIKSGSANYQQDGQLNEDDIEQLEELVKNDGIYRIRVGSKMSDGTMQFVSSFTKACALYESRLHDALTVHVDQLGNVIGVSLTTPALYCLGLQVHKSQLTGFHTTVDVIQTVPGPVPETQAYVEKIERDRAEKAQGQQQDTRSFFGKYWIYIVPVVILLMFANSADPNSQGGR